MREVTKEAIKNRHNSDSVSYTHLGINSKWVTYMTVAPKATVKPSDGGAQNAEYWRCV